MAVGNRCPVVSGPRVFVPSEGASTMHDEKEFNLVSCTSPSVDCCRAAGQVVSVELLKGSPGATCEEAGSVRKRRSRW